MKPLLSAPATVEDLDIWLGIMKRWRLRYGSKAMARFDLDVYAGDRRDADLMFALCELGPRVGGVAWAHRRVRAALTAPGGMWIGGLWVNLA